MQLQIGDRLTDSTGEWEIIGPTVHDERREDRRRPRQEGRAASITEIRTWGAHERVSVKRATAEKGNR
jgi:hypothetical protein